MRLFPRSRSFHKLFLELRTEGGSSPGRDAWAVGLGTFIGCTPFYGFHLLIVMALGRVLHLNRLKMYLASHISNPLFAPILIFAEIQVGAWLLRRDLHGLSIEAIRHQDPWVFGGDLLVGALALGAVLGVALALATYVATARGPRLEEHVSRVFDRAADRYLSTGIAPWEMARGKLKRDPVYAAAFEMALPPLGTLVDVGCGRGLMLAALREAERSSISGEWPVDRPPPSFDTLIGIEHSAHLAAVARRALGDEADIVHGDALEALPPAASAVLLFDVLHLLARDRQDRLLAAIVRRLEPGGVLLVREVDRAAGTGFQLVRLGNRLKNVLVGRWRTRFHFRTAAEWHDAFAELGFEVEPRSMGQGTPFANVLFRLQKPRHGDRRTP